MFDIESLLQYGGLLAVFLAVFAQTGLFFCFFLPSGGLMFTAGVFVASGQLDYNIVVVCLLLTLAAMLGNAAGYAFGRKAGPLLFERKQSRFLKREHLEAAEGFYSRHGGKALAGGMFFPVIRTFAPIVAGMIKMKFQRFFVFTTIGSVGWIFSFVLAGYLIGSMPFLKPYLTYIVLGVILAVTTPIVVRIVRTFQKSV